MKIGPKFKIARRLGAPIFEKTQTQKYALSLARKEKTGKRAPRPKSEFGLQLIEKQKARFTYGIAEKQFRNYVWKALRSTEPMQKLFELLETRLDSTLYRSGFAKTRAQGRQIAGHGQILVNGRRVTIPSLALRVGDVVSLRPGASDSPLFGETAEMMRTMTVPAWLEVDPDKREAKITGTPVYVRTEQNFDLGSVIEFYNR